MIKFTGLNTDSLYIPKWAITAIYSAEGQTFIDIGSETFQVKESVEEAIELWETTE